MTQKGLTYRGPLQKPGLSERNPGNERAAQRPNPGFALLNPGYGLRTVTNGNKAKDAERQQMHTV